MAEMKLDPIEGSISLRFGKTEVTKQFKIPLTGNLETRYLNGDKPGVIEGTVTIHAEEFRKKIDALLAWIETFPVGIENG